MNTGFFINKSSVCKNKSSGTKYIIQKITYDSKNKEKQYKILKELHVI